MTRASARLGAVHSPVATRQCLSVVRYRATRSTIRRDRGDECHGLDAGARWIRLLLQAIVAQETAPPMTATTFITERLDELEANLPAVPARVVRLQRAVAGAASRPYRCRRDRRGDVDVDGARRRSHLRSHRDRPGPCGRRRCRVIRSWRCPPGHRPGPRPGASHRRHGLARNHPAARLGDRHRGGRRRHGRWPRRRHPLRAVGRRPSCSSAPASSTSRAPTS